MLNRATYMQKSTGYKASGQGPSTAQQSAVTMHLCVCNCLLAITCELHVPPTKQGLVSGPKKRVEAIHRSHASISG